MNMMDLLEGVPGLLDSVKDAGIPEEKLPSLGSGLAKQLGGDDGFDFTDLLTGLDLDGFVSQIDVAALAEHVGVSPAVAQQVVGLIAPKVAEFNPTAGGLGGLVGSLAGKLFK